jgi:hypothetical protein
MNVSEFGMGSHPVVLVLDVLYLGIIYIMSF